MCHINLLRRGKGGCNDGGAMSALAAVEIELEVSEVGLGTGGNAGGCNRSRGGGWESEDRKSEGKGCDKKDGILDDGEGDTEEVEEGCDKAFSGKTKEFMHFTCLPSCQLVQAIFCLAQEQPLQRLLFHYICNTAIHNLKNK